MPVDFRYGLSTEAHIQNISCVKNVKNLVFLKKKKYFVKVSSVLQFHLKYQPEHNKLTKPKRSNYKYSSTKTTLMNKDYSS